MVNLANYTHNLKNPAGPSITLPQCLGEQPAFKNFQATYISGGTLIPEGKNLNSVVLHGSQSVTLFNWREPGRKRMKRRCLSIPVLPRFNNFQCVCGRSKEFVWVADALSRQSKARQNSKTYTIVWHLSEEEKQYLHQRMKFNVTN